MTPYDYAVLAFYFVYLLVISWVFRRLVHNVNDYFRSGGQVIWWMAGGSAFIVSFSAWTFTGAASRAYADGWPIMVIYLANAVGFVASAWYFAPRFRQLRVVTSMQAVRARFGPVNEQFFTWLTLPLRLMYAGIWLYGLGVFFAAAFGMDVTRTILLAGGTVTVIALIGGSWAVVASDFIQVLILMPVTLVATVLAVARLGGGGRLRPPAVRHPPGSRQAAHRRLSPPLVRRHAGQAVFLDQQPDRGAALFLREGQPACAQGGPVRGRPDAGRGRHLVRAPDGRVGDQSGPGPDLSRPEASRRGLVLRDRDRHLPGRDAGPARQRRVCRDHVRDGCRAQQHERIHLFEPPSESVWMVS